MRKWVVAYDIPEDRRRGKLAQLLENFGDRVQYSVFEVIAEESDIEGLVKKIESVIEVDEDKVRLYPLCETCAGKVMVVGEATTKPWEEPDVIVL